MFGTLVRNFNPITIFCHYFGEIFDLKGFSAFLRRWKNIKFDPTKPLLKIVLTPQVWLSGRKIIKNVFLDTEEKKAKICWSSWLFDLVTSLNQNSIFYQVWRRLSIVKKCHLMIIEVNYDFQVFDGDLINTAVLIFLYC